MFSTHRSEQKMNFFENNFSTHVFHLRSTRKGQYAAARQDPFILIVGKVLILRGWHAPRIEEFYILCSNKRRL
jgi:hypothetical protein